METKIRELEQSLVESVFFNIENTKNISRSLNDIFYDFTKLKIVDYKYRQLLLNIFSKYTPQSTTFLIRLFANLCLQLKQLNINKTEILDENYDTDMCMLIYKDILSNHQGKPIRISNFKLDIDLEEQAKKEFYCFTRNIIEFDNSTTDPLNIKPEDIHTKLILYCINHDLARSLYCLEEFYALYGQFADNLNLSHMYQLNRDLSEELLLTSFNDNRKELGWFNLFRVYTGQYNIIDSLFYGITYLISILNKNNLSMMIFNQTIHKIFIFLRNFSLNRFADEFYHAYKDSLELNDYENQKFNCSYFLFLLNKSDETVINKVKDYLEQHFKSIIAYEQNSAKPWLTLLLNIQYKFPNKKRHTDDLNKYIPLFEEYLDEGFVRSLKGRALSKNTDCKQELINGILKSQETRNKEDYVSEIYHLLIIANRLMNISTENNDVGGFLLASIIKNDSSINFKPKYIEGNILEITNFENKDDHERKLLNYQSFLTNQLNFQDNQICLLIFENQGYVYFLTYQSEKFSKIYRLTNWSIDYMKNWLKENLKDFACIDTSSNCLPNYGLEDDKIKILKEQLSFTKINIPKNKEVFIVYDVELSLFPHNLIQNSDGDFISSRSPISNILSLEYYINQNSTLNNLSNDYTISVWIPTESQDLTIQFVDSKLETLLEKYPAKFYRDTLPSKQIESDINIFVAHGNVGLEGFKAIYTNSNTCVKNPSSIFGKGKIAILFICHSGLTQKKTHRHQISSLINNLIEIDYQSIIAPFWSLKIDIIDIWLKEFLSQFSSGNTLANTVFFANKEVENHHKSPSAWAAMHLYGNPNIRINITPKC